MGRAMELLWRSQSSNVRVDVFLEENVSDCIVWLGFMGMLHLVLMWVRVSLGWHRIIGRERGRD